MDIKDGDCLTNIIEIKTEEGVDRLAESLKEYLRNPIEGDSPDLVVEWGQPQVMLEKDVVDEPIKNKIKWELLSKGDCSSTQRLCIPGGWVVRSVFLTPDRESGISISMTFIPDPEHEWLTESEINIDNIKPIIGNKPFTESEMKK